MDFLKSFGWRDATLKYLRHLDIFIEISKYDIIQILKIRILDQLAVYPSSDGIYTNNTNNRAI